MNRLKEAVEARKAEGPIGPLCYSEHWQATATLRIETSSAEIWVFPWHQFVHSRHQTEGQLERLVLTFASNDIILCGTHLTELLEKPISEQRLERLRPVPKKYQGAEVNEPFVMEILVRPVAD